MPPETAVLQLMKACSRAGQKPDPVSGATTRISCRPRAGIVARGPSPERG